MRYPGSFSCKKIQRLQVAALFLRLANMAMEHSVVIQRMLTFIKFVFSTATLKGK